MKTKQILSIILTLALLLCVPVFDAGAEDNAAAVPSFVVGDGLYAHGAADLSDTEAWTRWQNAKDRYGMAEEGKEDKFYFFLPSGSDSKKVQLYNSFDESVKIGEVTITAQSAASFDFEPDTEYDVYIGEDETVLKAEFKRSTAEAAVYVNNMNADGNGTALFEYLTEDKSYSAKAKGAIVNKDGSVDHTAIKKIKGRGNTTWSKAKKPFNITYDSTVSIGGMSKGKKFSLLANYQDASLARNRILYDLADDVGMPYASDSRFVDFYMNGEYLGSYQCAQKIDVGKNSLINDISDTDYLNPDGTLADKFSFCIEIDPSFSDDDYHISGLSNEITIKSPEIASGGKYYSEVKNVIKTEYTSLISALAKDTSAEKAEKTIDIDSFAKMFLINELGKNWDSGVSSLYMVYKKSPDGNWRFYASPVWDYDNSLGNCVGIENELNRMGVSDYTKYTGWWCRYKGKSARETVSKNIMNRCANSKIIQARAAQIWMYCFAPKLERFVYSDTSVGKLYSAKEYYELLKGSADMNYTRGWAVNTGSWIADHSGLKIAYYDEGGYFVDSDLTSYEPDFEGEYNYMRDWLSSRAAWLTNEFAGTYEPIKGNTNEDLKFNINDATAVQYALAGHPLVDYHAGNADYNADGRVNIDDVTAMQLALSNGLNYKSK